MPSRRLPGLLLSSPPGPRQLRRQATLEGESPGLRRCARLSIPFSVENGPFFGTIHTLLVGAVAADPGFASHT
jgi:hypothetical protein